MTPDAAGALLHMAQATTADEAMDWCWQAHDAGASWTDCRQAYAEWERLQATQVQTVGDELPPYSHKPAALPDGTPVIGWSGPTTTTNGEAS